MRVDPVDRAFIGTFVCACAALPVLVPAAPVSDTQAMGGIQGVAPPLVAALLVSNNNGRTEQVDSKMADAAELAGEWRVTHLAGAPVMEGSRLALRFTASGEVSGNASCNRFSGSYTAEAGSLRIGGAEGNLATTRMMCPEPVMAQEDRFLRLIPSIDAYEITVAGTLILRAAGTEVLSAESA
jgi:heat shock protein HslJ